MVSCFVSNLKGGISEVVLVVLFYNNLNKSCKVTYLGSSHNYLLQDEEPVFFILAD